MAHSMNAGSVKGHLRSCVPNVQSAHQFRGDEGSVVLVFHRKKLRSVYRGVHVLVVIG